MKNERKKFILKVTITHVLTYIICGIIFSQIFTYQESLNDAGMRDMNDIIVNLAPVFQIIRGLLFAIVLWMIKDVFMNKKYGWLKLWIILIMLGIFNTPGTAPGSIEGFIYLLPSNEPLNIQIGGMLEILIQTLIFSVIVTHNRKTK